MIFGFRKHWQSVFICLILLKLRVYNSYCRLVFEQMDYLKEEETLLAIRNATALYQKQEYTSAILLLLSHNRGDNTKLLEILTKCYYNLKMFAQSHEICSKLLSSMKQFDTETKASFLYLLTLSEYQLNIDTWKNHKQELDQLVNLTVDWSKIKKQKPSAVQLRNNIQKLIKEEQNFKYFSQSQLPVYLIPISWFQNLEEGKVESVNSLNMLQLAEYIDTQKSCLHYNYLVKESLMECQDYRIVGANTWKYISQEVGGTQIKRYTIKSSNTVMVESKFRILRVLCVTLTKTKLVSIPVSRIEAISQIKDRIKRLLIRFNLIDKQAILMTKSPKLIQVKNIYNPQILTKFIFSSTGPIIDFPCTELSDQSTMIETQILPKQFLVFELSKTGIFHSKKQEASQLPSNRCIVCSSEDPPILCECKTVKYCSNKCKANNNKHQDLCKKLIKEKTGLHHLISAFQIDKHSRVPQDLRSGKSGLENIGNTCFLNAALQCIIGIDKLSNYFFKNQHLNDINFRNPLGSQGRLACAYGQFLKQYFFTVKRAIQPRTLKRIVEKKNSTFSGYEQQDSQQFLSYFLDLLHEDLNRIKDKPTVQNIESDGRPDKIISQITLENYHKRNNSIITDLMMGQYRSELLCPDCGKISITFDPYMTVTLPLPNNRNKLELEGYFIHKNGLIEKVREQVSNKTIGQTLADFSVKACHALIEKREIFKIYPLEQPIFTIANSKNLCFLYEIGDDEDVEFQFQVLDRETKQLISFTRRIFSKKIRSQKELEQLAYDCLTEPFIKAFRIKGNRADYLKFCSDNEIITFEQSKPDRFPIEKGVHKLRVYLKSDLKSKVKLNFSTGSIDLSRPQKQLTIPNLLKNFSIPQKLTEDNSWYCNVCKKHQLATKKLSLYSVPQYLILHLKRFSNKIHGRYVFNQKIDTPLKLNEIEEVNGKKYELFGIVNHMGNMSGGHYTSFVKKNEWLYFDDERCRKVELSGVYAYLLFYKAIKE